MYNISNIKCCQKIINESIESIGGGVLNRDVNEMKENAIWQWDKECSRYI